MDINDKIVRLVFKKGEKPRTEPFRQEDSTSVEVKDIPTSLVQIDCIFIDAHFELMTHASIVAENILERAPSLTSEFCIRVRHRELGEPSLAFVCRELHNSVRTMWEKRPAYYSALAREHQRRVSNASQYLKPKN